MKLTILAALFAAVLAQGGVDYCDQAAFNACNAQLGTFWRVDSSMIWDNLQYMGNAINSLIRPPYNVYNYVNICNGWSQFYACLGQNNIRRCLGTIGFVGTGKSPADAYAYEGFLADWRFKCGVGFFSVYEVPAMVNCTESTYVNYATEMATFFQTYNQNIQADPNNACTYAQTLMNGIGNVYASGPCRSADAKRAQWYGCQSAREYSNAQFKHCQTITKCSPSTSASNSEVRTNSKGEVEFLLHEHFAKNEQGEWIKEPERWI